MLQKNEELQKADQKKQFCCESLLSEKGTQWSRYKRHIRCKVDTQISCFNPHPVYSICLRRESFFSSIYDDAPKEASLILNAKICLNSELPS